MTKPHIIAGSAKGKQLVVPEGTRPITSRTKQSVFDLLRGYIEDTTVLDLYAGSGNMGLEALSRGALSAVFVDIEREAVQIIIQNIKNCGFDGNAIAYRYEANDYLRKAKQEFDLIFVDPPFPEFDKFQPHLLLKVMHEKSIAIIRKPDDQELALPQSLQVLHTQRYGRSEMVFASLQV